MRTQTKNITIRLTQEEYEILKKRVADSKMKQIDFIRNSILYNQIISTDGIVKIIPELGRIGNNINQIAKACNMGNKPQISELNKQTEMLKKIFEDIICFIRTKSIEATIPQMSKQKMEKTILNLLEIYSEKVSDQHGNY